MNATLTDLLTQLATTIAAVTTFVFVPTQGQSRNLYIVHLPDTHPGWTIDAVVRSAGGQAKLHDPIDRLSVQVMVRAADQGNGLDAAWSIYNAFTDANGLPLRRVSLGNNWLAFELDIAPPQGIGTDEAGRYLFTMNLNLSAATVA